MSRVAERIADSRVLALVRSYLDQGVMEELPLHEPTERGTPQGAVISPLLANIYLDPLDHLVAAAGVQMVRYADDFVLLCRSEEQAKAALARVQAWVADNGLTLHPDKTRLVDATRPGGFDFLGYHFERGQKWPPQGAGPVQRQGEGANPAQQWGIDGSDDRVAQRHAPRLVWLLQTQQPRPTRRTG